MRVAANHADPDYPGDALIGRVHVTCDGMACLDVVEADDAAGTVVVLVRDDQGNLLLDGDEVRKRVITGAVTIRTV